MKNLPTQHFPDPNDLDEQTKVYAERLHDSSDLNNREIAQRLNDLDETIEGFWVNVKAYGAKGDGVTDDTGAIQAAITAASPSSGVCFPPGIYMISGTTTLTANLTMLGLGQAVIDGSDADSSFVVGGNLSIKVTGMKFQNFTGHVFSADSTARVVSDFVFTDNQITTCGSGVWLNCVVVGVIATGNQIWDLDRAGSVYGFGFGTNNYDDQDDSAKFIIAHNHIYDLNNSTSLGECHAVIIYGHKAVIANNTIEDIVNSGNGLNAEGIYTKCRHATIINNVMVDAGTGEGSINIKGSIRDQTISPQGYRIICAHNHLYSSGGAYTGISNSNEDITIAGNYIEGFGEYAIRTDSFELSNIAINDNIIRGHRGVMAILTQHYGTLLSVSGNRIYDLPATQGTIVNATGIRVQAVAGDLEDVVINDNIIYHDGACGATTRIYGVAFRVDSGRTADRVSIRNNHIYINHATLSEFGFRIAATGTITTISIAGNDASGVPAYPLFVDTPANISDFVIQNNVLYGTQESGVGTVNLEFYHTDHKCTNNGANSTGDGFTLPAAQPGLKFTFVAVDDYDMYIDPDGTDIIRGGGAGKYLNLDDQGDSVVLECFTANEWEITGGYGTYAYEA
ncbi:MAG: glycosyl hydrolase family 28-related protein [Planctomycetota bacterium]|jgi:polygalacturonase